MNNKSKISPILILTLSLIALLPINGQSQGYQVKVDYTFINEFSQPNYFPANSISINRTINSNWFLNVGLNSPNVFNGSWFPTRLSYSRQRLAFGGGYVSETNKYKSRIGIGLIASSKFYYYGDELPNKFIPEFEIAIFKKKSHGINIGVTSSLSLFPTNGNSQNRWNSNIDQLIDFGLSMEYDLKVLNSNRVSDGIKLKAIEIQGVFIHPLMVQPQISILLEGKRRSVYKIGVKKFNRTYFGYDSSYWSFPYVFKASKGIKYQTQNRNNNVNGFGTATIGIAAFMDSFEENDDFKIIPTLEHDYNRFMFNKNMYIGVHSSLHFYYNYIDFPNNVTPYAFMFLGANLGVVLN